MAFFVSRERFEALASRNEQFKAAMGEPERPVVRVFEPLTAKHLQELQLIREVSRDLQKKTKAQTVTKNKVATSEENEPTALGE